MMYKTNDKSRHIFQFQYAYCKLRKCNHRLHLLFGKVHAMQTQTPLEIRRSSLQCTLSPEASLRAPLTVKKLLEATLQSLKAPFQ